MRRGVMRKYGEETVVLEGHQKHYGRTIYGGFRDYIVV